MYSRLDSTASLIDVSSLSGMEPILENLSAMVDRRFTSLSMSVTMLLSTPIVSSNWVHAMSEEMGVPS